MAAELVTAERRAGYDLEELARRVRQLAEVRGLEGPDRPIPEGEAGARLAPGQWCAVLALAELAAGLAAELRGLERPPAEPVATVGELRRLLLPLPADAPLLAPRALDVADPAAARVVLARLDAEHPDRWRWSRRLEAGARLALLVVPRG